MELDIRQKKVVEAKEDKILCLAAAGSGKACPNSSKIPTPNGWITVGEVKAGGYLFDKDGNPTKVLGVYPQGEKEVYEITFGDGRKAKCSIDHIWTVHKKTWKDIYSFKEYTLKDILEDNWERIDKRGHKEHLFSIPCSKAVKYNVGEKLNIDPYLFGVFLGDGCCRQEYLTLSSNDKEIVEEIQRILNCPKLYKDPANYSWYFYKNINNELFKTKDIFKDYMNSICCYSYDKSIPDDFKYTSIENRYALIQGLMDTDGSIWYSGGRYSTKFYTTSPKLRDDFIEIMGSLGYICTYRIDKREKYTNGEAYAVSINIPNSEKHKLFRLKRKKEIALESINKKQSRHYDRTTIIDIQDLGYQEEMTCFYVDNNEHLFLTENFIVTHNTRCLTERVRYLLNNNCKPQDIACITYTNMAADEMKKRLGNIADGVFIGTIHSLANNVCVSNGINTDKYIADIEFDMILKKALTIPTSKYPKFQHLLIDEFQDTGALEYNFIEKIPTKNFFAIGDERQCQPAGTKIKLRNGVIKNIEDIKVGDSIIWFSQKDSYICGNKVSFNSIEKKVEKVASRDFVNDDLITITTETGKQTKYTPNHIGFVKLHDSEYQHVVYLMCNGKGRFRIGKIPMYANNKSRINPWRTKMSDEGCTKLWLLKAFKTDKEARLLEQKLSYKYQIPQTCWQIGKVQWTEEDINYIYEGLNTYESAKACLKEFHRNIDYPLLDNTYDNAHHIHFAKNAVTQIYACNIMPEVMDFLIHDETQKHKKKYEQIKKVEYDFIKEPIKVYSLQTEGGTYIADEIVTHNCIYQFKGASDKYLRNLYLDAKCKTYLLNKNYRCAPNIISYADSLIASMSKLSPKTEPVKSKNGYIRDDFSFSEAIEELEWSQDWGNWFILCRTNNELATAVDILEKKNIPNISFKKGDLDLIEMETLLKDNRVKVLTIHTAKGLENKNVIVTGARLYSEEERKIAYVAATRAEQSLYWCPSICRRGKIGRPSNRDVADAGKVFEKASKNMVDFG